MSTDYQHLLFPYAYNILGSTDDARDAIQDVLLKFITLPKDGIADERNYLIRSVINRAINIKNRNKRITHNDVWLPEPVATEDADRDVHLKDILSYSLLVLLERLNAQERAVFILRESFDYAHQEIADTLDITEENSRKLLSRAKDKLFKTGKVSPKAIHTKMETKAMLDKYIEAIRSKDMTHIEELLAEDIVFYADGGAKLQVVKKLCIGSQDVADLLLFVYHQYQSSYQIVMGEVNHQPALLYYHDGELKVCQVFEMSPEEGKITQINSIVDPEKIRHIQVH
ncbi:sigma-70 family RNA polymerase sigma factor [Parapedobacter tibetensis]|uniref:sigma-70 family RNA polymerase sigma factor n=1 Tax=Parapedobacter tibetensis TaxID=2972951 RepID=UPI00214D8F5D|nr:sigma-70 family RNA polymerase sigma factor [Parapedobacter tibetensis]